MFTWICPQCGREVPPSYSECPTCTERRQQAAAPPQPAQAPPPPQQPAYAPPQPQAAPPPQQPGYAPPQQYQQPQYAPPQYQQPQYPPPQYQQPQYQPPPAEQQPLYTIGETKKGMPAWLIAVLTIAVLGGALFGAYKVLAGKGPTTATTKPALETPGGAQPGASPFVKYIEVVGIRLLESDKQKPLIRYTVVNHAPAALQGLQLRITLLPNDPKAGTDPFFSVDANVGNVPAYGARDMESPVQTKLRVYELPDWQFVKATFEVTAPK